MPTAPSGDGRGGVLFAMLGLVLPGVCTHVTSAKGPVFDLTTGSAPALPSASWVLLGGLEGLRPVLCAVAADAPLALTGDFVPLLAAPPRAGFFTLLFISSAAMAARAAA